MNSTLNTIKERRSTRRFKQEQIPKEALDAIIEAGLYAPSAHNQQSWHFTVVQDSKLIKELNQATKKSLLKVADEGIQKMASNEAFDIFYGGPTVIVVSGENAAMMPMVDCAAATENMFIAAESLNIGGCWNGFIGRLFSSPEKVECVEKLQIPEGYTPYYAAVFGHIESRAKNAPSRRENTVNYI